MKNDTENIILFPKWREILEEKGLKALKEKRYEEALEAFEELLDYDVQGHEIIIGKLLCLMELGKHTEAQLLCEDAMHQKDDHYFHYVHIYLTILFQTNQYELLMEQVEHELKDRTLPEIMREQFQQLYTMSEKMKDDIHIEKSSTYIDDLMEAIEANDYKTQWRTIKKLQALGVVPASKVVDLLHKDGMHPVIQTAIFQWLQAEKYPYLVHIHKLGMELDVKPIDIPEIEVHLTVKQVLFIISKLEQSNPTLYELIVRLLYRYLYVKYPFFPANEDTPQIAKALEILGEQYFMGKVEEEINLDDRTQKYIEEITICEKLYLSIIED
ncbi:tetratricopeptide repeat protein [Virgibacillus sp. LDC-1]|uniref:tetratricopeptide repeat protein n=1 Tax=Virgibacillus sp. LDC-1 TaxID=3039856 RepID=UPI0024DEEEB1|nr:tetratricopeptide repeat protein [Virgibacillus sp. LDC-1]